MTGLFIFVGTVALALGFGLWRALRDGRARATAPDRIPGLPMGETATLVQFSSAICSPCVTTRRLLTEVAEDQGVEHVDLDVEQHMDLVERFGVTRTPTVLVLDAGGVVRHRIVGVPLRRDLEGVIDRYMRTEQEAG